MGGFVSTHGPARDPAGTGQLWLRHRLDAFFRPGLQCSGRGEMLHKADIIATTLYYFFLALKPNLQWSKGQLEIPKQHLFCLSHSLHKLLDLPRLHREWLDKSFSTRLLESLQCYEANEFATKFSDRAVETDDREFFKHGELCRLWLRICKSKCSLA